MDKIRIFIYIPRYNMICNHAVIKMKTIYHIFANISREDSGNIAVLHIKDIA